MTQSPLQQRIHDHIANLEGKLSFADFMQLALYTPGLGYYMADNLKFGKQGDFITAPTLSPHFARSLANELAPLIKEHGLTTLIEFGAGDGSLCRDLLLALKNKQALPEHYLIVELSGGLKALQAETIQSESPELVDRVSWCQSLPEEPLDAIVIANEVLDAMPVHRFAIVEGELKEGVVLSDGEQFTEAFEPPSSRLSDALAPLLPSLPHNYHSEINLNVRPWLNSIRSCLNKGVVFLIDYGFNTQTYYHPSRHMGTVMCHKQHKAHPNPYVDVGEQDITAHVDFGWVAHHARSLDFSLLGYTSQGAFLLANGLLEQLNDLDEKARFNANQVVKQLTLPQEMGELFKVLALGVKVDARLSGFSMVDLSHQL